MTIISTPYTYINSHDDDDWSRTCNKIFQEPLFSGIVALETSHPRIVPMVMPLVVIGSNTLQIIENITAVVEIPFTRLAQVFRTTKLYLVHILLMKTIAVLITTPFVLIKTVVIRCWKIGAIIFWLPCELFRGYQKTDEYIKEKCAFYALPIQIPSSNNKQDS